MWRVYLAGSLADGQLLVDHLAESGVPSEMFHQNSQGGLGELAVTYPEIWIKRNADLDKAKRLIAQFENRRREHGSLVCGSCNESNPDSFEICWQCRMPLAVVED